MRGASYDIGARNIRLGPMKQISPAARCGQIGPSADDSYVSKLGRKVSH
jgi:hypothetical protein